MIKPYKLWDHAIIHVLGDANCALHYTEVTERILSNGFYMTDGETPDMTVGRNLSQNKYNYYIRTAPGTYKLSNDGKAEFCKITKGKKLYIII